MRPYALVILGILIVVVLVVTIALNLPDRES